MSIATPIQLWLRQRRAVMQCLQIFRHMASHCLLRSLGTGVSMFAQDCPSTSILVSIYDSCSFEALDLRPLRPAPSLPHSLFLSTVLLNVLFQLIPHVNTLPEPTAPSSCSILVTMPYDLPPTKARWRDIWRAGIAVNTMCIKHGFTGKGVGLGKSHRVYRFFL